MKIQSLTEKQEFKFDQYVKEWTKIGLNTNKIIWDNAVKAVKLAYKLGGLEPPKKYIYCTSPLVANITINILGEEKNNFKWETIEGSHLANLAAFYSFFRNELNMKKQTDKILGLIEVIKECGWCYLYKDIAFICERHTKLNLDENGKLHSDNDFAFQYLDGYGETYWHGTKIPQWIIFEKNLLTAKIIFEEKNKEIQRCMIEIYGRNKLIEQEGKLISSDDWGDLYEIPKFKDSFGKPLKFLKVINYSPIETSYLSKSEIDKIVLKAQSEIGNNGMYRHGDIILISKFAKTYTKEEAEIKNKEFKILIIQEIELLMRKKQINNDIQFKEYFLQIKPSIKTAFEAWQSCHRKLNIDKFLPIIAT